MRENVKQIGFQVIHQNIHRNIYIEISMETDFPIAGQVEKSTSVVSPEKPQEEPIDLTFSKSTNKKLKRHEFCRGTRKVDVFAQPTTQQEVLNAAKSLFSKRNRTLYHWMFPDASHHQLKQFVANKWDSLSAEEKAVYIAQVTGKCNYSQDRLMVNPQLGNIRDLPPPLSNTEIPKRARVSQMRKRGRRMKLLSNFAGGFEDDPELTEQLARFASAFKNDF